MYHGGRLPLSELSPVSDKYRISAVVRDITPLVRNPSVKNILADTVTWHVQPPTGTVKRAHPGEASGSLSAAIENGTLIIRDFTDERRTLRVAAYTLQGKCILSGRCVRLSRFPAAIPLESGKLNNGMYIITLHDHTSSVSRNTKTLITE